MRICFVCNEYPPGPHGGIGTFTQVLARGLVKAGHDVRVAGMYGQNYPSPDYEEDHGVRVWRFRKSKRRLGWVASRVHLYREIAAWSRQGDIDLVEVPDWTGSAAVWPKLAIPVVARLNGSASYFAKEINGPVRRTTFWLEKSSLRRVDYWSSVSRYTAEKTRRLFNLRSGPDAILYNPVELAEPNHGRRDNQDVVFSGTLTEKKGVIPLLEAWPGVLAACPAARLHIYGKDRTTSGGRSMQKHLVSLLSDDELPTARFHGHVDRAELFRVLRQARVSVFPSYAEAFALAPLEAMACGCPTISSSRGSGVEMMRDGVDGLLVDPDHPEQISEAVTAVLRDDSLAERISCAGRRRVEQCFSIDILIAKNEAFFRRCIEQYALKES